MSKKKIAIIIWSVAGFLFLILGLALGHAKDGTTTALSSTTSSADSSVGASQTPTPSPTPSPTPTPTVKPVPKPAPRPAGPATFVLPDFTDMDENEVDTWFYNHNISVSTEFDYGDAEGTDCADAGDGIVEDQTPDPGTRLKNSLSTDVYLSVYCDY